MKLEYATIQDHAEKGFNIKPEDFDRGRFEGMIESLLEGKPVAVSGADPEIVLLRTLLLNEGSYLDSNGHITNLQGAVYWTKDFRMAMADSLKLRGLR